MSATLSPNPLEQLSIEQLRTRTSVKWRAHPADVLPLWVAEMDVPLAPPVAAAVHAAIDAGDTGYPSGEAYAAAVRSFARRRWDWDFDPARTAVVADVMTGIAELLKLLTGPDDPVVVCAPVYPPFFVFARDVGRRVLQAPLAPDGRLDLAALGATLARAGGRPVLLLANPHNPTGVAHTRAELEAVAALARRHGARVIADEIHAPVVLEGAAFTPYLSVDERGFSLLSGSKGWNLAGLKAALVIAGESAPELDRLPETLRHAPCHVGVIAHTAAFRDGGPWLDALLAGLAHNRALLGEQLAAQLPQIGFRAPEATYLAWLDCRALGEDPAGRFLQDGRVALNCGIPYGQGGAGFVRLNFATSPAILCEAVRRMAEVTG